MNMLVAIVGMAGSGKSEVAKMFRDKWGFAGLRFGAIVEEGVLEEGKALNEANEREFRERLRRELGMEALATLMGPRIVKLKRQAEKIIIDGLYSLAEYEYLKAEHPELIVVGVYARPVVRYGRLQHRPHRPLTMEEARSRDIAEIVNMDKGGPIALADFMIINDGTKQELTAAAAAVYRMLKREN